MLNRVKDWLRQGGTLVTLAEATRWAVGSGVGLLDTNALLKDGRPDVPATTGAAPSGRAVERPRTDGIHDRAGRECHGEAAGV